MDLDGRGGREELGGVKGGAIKCEKGRSIFSGGGNIAFRIWFGHELDANKYGTGPKRRQIKL